MEKERESEREGERKRERERQIRGMWEEARERERENTNEFEYCAFRSAICVCVSVLYRSLPCLRELYRNNKNGPGCFLEGFVFFSDPLSSTCCHDIRHQIPG